MRRLTARLAMASALIWAVCGWISPPVAGGTVLQTPPGLKLGDKFRFVFVTDFTALLISDNIVDYDRTVQSGADGATYSGLTVNWLAIGSTSTVNAIDHIGQTNTPVYLVDGTEVTTSTTPTGLWSGSLLHSINEDINGTRPTVFATEVHTGTSTTGLGVPGLTLGSTFGQALAGDWTSNTSSWVDSETFPTGVTAHFYGISEVLTVGATVPEPTSMLLMGTGVAMVGAYGWTRRRRDQRW